MKSLEKITGLFKFKRDSQTNNPSSSTKPVFTMPPIGHLCMITLYAQNQTVDLATTFQVEKRNTILKGNIFQDALDTVSQSDNLTVSGSDTKKSLDTKECASLVGFIKKNQHLTHLTLSHLAISIDDFMPIAYALYDNRSLLELDVAGLTLVDGEHSLSLGKHKKEEDNLMIFTFNMRAGQNKKDIRLSFSEASKSYVFKDVTSDKAAQQLTITDRNRAVYEKKTPPVSGDTQEPNATAGGVTMPVLREDYLPQSQNKKLPTIAVLPVKTKNDSDAPDPMSGKPTSASRSSNYLRWAAVGVTLAFAVAMRVMNEVEQDTSPFNMDMDELSWIYAFRWGVGITVGGLVLQLAHSKLSENQTAKTSTSRMVDGVLIVGLTTLFALAAGMMVSGYLMPHEAMDGGDKLTKQLFTGMYSVFGAVALGSIVTEAVSGYGYKDSRKPFFVNR